MSPIRAPDTILLTHSYYLRYDAKQVEKMKPYPPLATLIVAALLRERGYQVRLFDAMLAEGVEEFAACLEDARPSIVAIVEDNFNFLTKMCTIRMREACLAMIRAARARDARVVVNGSDASDHPELYLAAGADAVILGEPEYTLLELLDRWSRNPQAPVADIAGLGLPGDESNTTRTPPRPFITDLDALPFPAWDLVDAERYRRAWTAAHGRLSLNIVTSRGCPYHCNWCAKPLFGKRYAQRSPANAAEELRRVRRDVGADHVWFADDIFGLTPDWIEAFAREVTDRRARTPFMMQSRVNLMKPRVVAALAQAGAEEVWLGVESGSQKILDAMDKGTKLDQVRAATQNLRADGIRVGWFIQLGYLGEEWEDIVLTRDLVRDELPDEIGVSVSYPLPGTPFYETVRAQLGRKHNWQDSGDLAMMFQGTFSSDTYRRVRNLLHAEVDADVRTSAMTRRRLDARWADVERSAANDRAAATL